MSEIDNNINPPPSPPATGLQPMPDSPLALFWAFSTMAVQGVGGILAVLQREVVERRRWLTREEFLGLMAIGQILPGPNMVNLSVLIGSRGPGWRGALASGAGMLVLPAIVAMLLAASYSSLQSMPAVQGALRGMGGIIIALVLTNAVKMSSALRRNIMGWKVCLPIGVAMFVAVGLARLPLLLCMVVLGGLGYAWAYHRLGQARAADQGRPS